MFTVTRFADYAARVVLHLACQEPGALVPIPELAAARDLPIPFLRRVVSRLSEAGIVRTVRGAAGGVALGRDSSQISLQDLLVAMEGPTCASPCLESPKGCPFAAGCPVRSIWADATGVLENHFASVRFSDLADAERHRAAHRRIAPARRASRIKPPRA
jgi:Rrf2 family protein